MLTIPEHVLMGSLTAVLCLFGLWNARWFIIETRKGRKLVEWLGETTALWTTRALFLFGALFGILLAIEIIQPVQW